MSAPDGTLCANCNRPQITHHRATRSCKSKDGKRWLKKSFVAVSHAARTKLLMKFWAAMHLSGFAKEQEWEAQERIWVADLTRILKGE